MPHPAHLTQPQQFLWLVILEICPPGEGIFGWVQDLSESRVPPCKGAAHNGL
jgi:hypothetical protein